MSTTTTTTMTWSETQTGRWQRPLGENEAMIKLIGEGGKPLNKDAWALSITASFDMKQGLIENQSTNEALLKQGWNLLRSRHPSIATTVDENNILTYDVPHSEEALEAWVQETFVVIEDEDVELDSLVADLERRPCATLYWLKAKSAIVLQLSHWRTDGFGAMHLLNAFFSAVVDGSFSCPSSSSSSSSSPPPGAEIHWGREVVHLLPSVEEALGLPLQPDATIERATDEFFATLAHQINALPTPFYPNAGSPGKTRSAHLRFSRQETTHLDSQCQRKNICLEAAVHASVTAAAYSLVSSSSHHHTTTMRQSLRPRLPAPYNGPAGAAGLYTAGYMIKVPCTQTWLENAQYYEAAIREGASPELLCSRRAYAKRMTERLQKLSPPPKGSTPPSGLDVSYISDVDGLMATRYGNEGCNLEVKDITIGIEVISRHVYVFMWEFDGRLAMRAVFNEGFYEKGFGEDVLERVRKELVLNLGEMGGAV